MIAPRINSVPRSPPRDPSDIDGLTVWLQADRGVVLDSSGNVSEWRDLSGRGNHAAQATAGARPTYATAAGRKVVQTTKAARFLTIPSHVDLDPHATRGWSCYVAFSSSDASAQATLVGRWGAAAAQCYLIEVNDPATSGKIYISETGTNTARGVTTGDTSTGTLHVLRARYDPTGLVRAQQNATAYGPTAIAGVKSVATDVAIGRQSAADAAAGADANIYAIAWFRRDLPAVDDVFIRDYLRRTCGTP